MDNLEQFALDHYFADLDKAVPLGVLKAWLFEHHEHGEDGKAVVPSMDLERWAQKVAVTRVVDHESREDGDVWSFFEHGWHKAGVACESHLTQSRARIVRVPPDGLVPPPSFNE